MNGAMRSTDMLTGSYAAVYTNGYSSDGTCSNSNSCNSTATAATCASGNAVNGNSNGRSNGAKYTAAPTQESLPTPPPQASVTSRRFWLLVAISCIALLLLACAAVIVYIRVVYFSVPSYAAVQVHFSTASWTAAVADSQPLLASTHGERLSKR